MRRTSSVISAVVFILAAVTPPSWADAGSNQGNKSTPRLEIVDSVLSTLSRIWESVTHAPSVLPVEAPPMGTELNPPLINAGTAGLSVATSTGAFTTTHLDVAIPGRGPTAVLSRTYNSNDTRSGPLGPGWTHSYNMRIVDPGDGSGAAVVVGPQGRSDRYTPGTGGAFNTPAGVFSTLLRDGSGNYALTDADQSVSHSTARAD